MYGIQDFIKAVYEGKKFSKAGINFDYLKETTNFFMGVDSQFCAGDDGGLSYMFNKHTGELVGYGHPCDLPDAWRTERKTFKKIRLTYEVLDDEPEDENESEDLEDEIA